MRSQQNVHELSPLPVFSVQIITEPWSVYDCEAKFDSRFFYV